VTRRPKLATQWHPVDWVAVILALGLALTIVMILIVTGIQVIKGATRPQITLSDNATQIITAGTGALAGLLGAYIGVSHNGKNGKPPDAS